MTTGMKLKIKLEKEPGNWINGESSDEIQKWKPDNSTREPKLEDENDGEDI